MPRIMFTVANSTRNLVWRLLGAITVGVRILAFNENKVLLVRHVYKENWYLPGGGVKRLETLIDAASRELYEETGAKVRHLNLVGVFTNFAEGRSDHVILFAGEVIGMDKQRSPEITEAHFFNRTDLPNELDIQSRRRIEEYFEKRGSLTGLW